MPDTMRSWWLDWREPRPVGPHDAAEFLRAIVTTTPECIKVVSPDGRLLQMNPAGLDMIEAPDWQSVEGTSTLDVVAPEHRDLWWRHHDQVCQGNSLTWEFDIIGLERKRRHMETHAAPIRLIDGTIGQLAITRDVTDRINAAAAMQDTNDALETRIRARTHELEAVLARLTESETSFELLVNGVTDYAIFRLGPEGRIASWNAGAERIKGYTAAEILGRHFSCFYTPADQQSGLPMRSLATAASEGRVEMEGWRVRKDGSRFWANVVIDAIRNNGKLVGFAKITRDITERKTAEAQLRQAQKLEAIGQFTGGAAHDFNNLLMAIGSSLELLRKRLPDDRRMLSLLDTAMQGVARGASLTQRMLAFARRQELRQESVDLAILLSGTNHLLEQSVGTTISLETVLPRRLPQVQTDATQLEAVVLNLVVNARDAMPHGGRITIEARTERIDPGHPTLLPAGQYVCLSVRDSGTGMDEATLARATEPFFTTKGIGKGTGLGLSMVDGLMAQSNGKMVIRSEVGSGTTVELWLPVVGPQMERAQPERVPKPVAEPFTGQLAVLLVDDDPLVLANVASMLEDLGHSVITAVSGQRALEALDATQAIDLVISDQVMPGMTGIELAGEIRRRRPALPIILATGFAELPPNFSPEIPRLSKPFNQALLRETIAKQLRTRAD